MENSCPKCQHDFMWNGAYHCEPCDQDYEKVAFCPQCSAQLEKLQACGSASYFCNDCNELKSKSTVIIQFQAKPKSE